MKRIVFIACLLAACTPTETVEECYQQIIINTTCEETVTYCPFNTCFSKPTFTSHEFFQIEPISVSLSDDTCNEAFEEQYNTTSYLCYIQSAEIIRDIGRDDEGNTLIEWDVDCACSYE